MFERCWVFFHFYFLRSWMFERCGVSEVADIREGVVAGCECCGLDFPPKRFKGQI